MTYEEFLALPENHNNMIYEWINGQVVKMARPIVQHQKVCDNLVKFFGLYLTGKNCKLYSAIDVQLSEAGDPSHVSPDLCVICGINDSTIKRYIGAPELCIEILSSNKDHDLITKKRLYLENGVKEYWIVDHVNKSILVNIFTQGTYETKLYENGIFYSSLFPTYPIELKTVFEEITVAETIEYLKRLLDILQKECDSNDV